MEGRIHNLRKLSLKLDVSGTAAPISNTKLYVGSFGFVLLQVYVPVTQNRTQNSNPLCTVHRTVIDTAGNRKQFDLDKYNLLYVENVRLQNGEYMLFESPMPKAFTDIEGELELVFNYCELKENEQGEQVIVSRLTTNIYNTYVSAGGINDTELNVDIKSGESAQINTNTIAIEKLTDDVENLLKPPDNSEANQVGTASVEITLDGNLKFINLKGKTGDTGDTGLTPVITPLAVGLPAGSAPTVEKTGTTDNPILTFGLPKGDKGNTGAPFTIAKVYESIESMNEGYATDSVPIGGFVVIDSGDVENPENGRLYIKGDTQYDFITDLSGMQGFTGVGISQIVYDSTLSDGSFKYKIILTNNEFYYFTAPIGPVGDTGQAATITVGSTTTLPAGSKATVTERGTAQDKILDFGIPKGADGIGAGNTTVYIGGALAERVDFTADPQTQIDGLNATKQTVYNCNGINDNEVLSQISQDFLNESLTDYASMKIVVNGIVGETGNYTYGKIESETNPKSDWQLGVANYSGNRKLELDFTNAIFIESIINDDNTGPTVCISRIAVFSDAITLKGANLKSTINTISVGRNLLSVIYCVKSKLVNCNVVFGASTEFGGYGALTGFRGEKSKYINCNSKSAPISSRLALSGFNSIDSSHMNCIANIVNSGTGASYGFAGSGTYSNCTGSATAIPPSSNITVYGFYGNYDDTSYINCTGTGSAMLPSSSSLSAYGFYGNCTYSNCTGTGTASGQNGGVYGHGFHGNGGGNYSNCAGTGTGTGSGYGTGDGYGFSGSGVYCNCTGYGYGYGNAQSNGKGFYNSLSAPCEYTNCKGWGNGYGSSTSSGFGFDIGSGEAINCTGNGFVNSNSNAVNCYGFRGAREVNFVNCTGIAINDKGNNACGFYGDCTYIACTGVGLTPTGAKAQGFASTSTTTTTNVIIIGCKAPLGKKPGYNSDPSLIEGINVGFSNNISAYISGNSISPRFNTKIIYPGNSPDKTYAGNNNYSSDITMEVK